MFKGELEGDLEKDLKGDLKGDFRGDFKQDLEGDLLSISGQLRSRSRSGLVQVWFSIELKLDRGSIRSSLRYGLSTPYGLTKEQCWTVPPCSYLHGSYLLQKL